MGSWQESGTQLTTPTECWEGHLEERILPGFLGSPVYKDFTGSDYDHPHF